MRRVPGGVVQERVLKALADLRKARATLRQDPGDTKALHEYRKQARRTWAAVQLTELYLTPLHYARAVRLVANLADGLGRMRDDDVLAKRLKALARGKSQAMRAALVAAADPLPPAKRQQRIAQALARAKRKRLERPLQAILNRMRKGWQDPLGLVRSRLRQRSRGASISASIDALHALRLELKAYRYAVEALGKEVGRADAEAAKQAHKAADVLGRVMDAHALATVAAKAPPRVARTLQAAARRDGEAARREFAQAWATRWVGLRQVIS